jgi:hypothetical protein
MDVYDRRRAFKNMAEGNFTQADVDIISSSSLPKEDGREEVFEIDKLTGKKFKFIHAHLPGKSIKEGSKIEAYHHGKKADYWVVESWGNAGGIRIDEAYRIETQNDATMSVRRVKDPSELESVSRGMAQDIRRAFGR